MGTYEVSLESGKKFQIETQAEKQSVFSQPEKVERNPLETLLAQAPQTNTDEILNTIKSTTAQELKGFSNYGIMALAPRAASLITQAPFVKGGMEGLAREESLFSAGLEFGAKLFSKKSLPSALKSSLSTAIDSVTGKKLQTFGNVFKDELGFSDVAASIAGVIASAFTPSSVVAGVKGSRTPIKTPGVDTFLGDLKGFNKFKSEAISKVTGLPIEDVETALSSGARKVLSKAFQDDTITNDAAKIITKGLKEQVDSTGKVVGEIKSKLRASGITDIDTKPFVSKFKESMDEFFKKATNFRGREIPFSKESGLENDFKGLKQFMSEKFGKTQVTIDELMQTRDELSEILFKGFTRGGMKEIRKPSTKAESVLRTMRNEITDYVHNLSPELKEADQANVIARDLRDKGAKWFDEISRGEKFLNNIDSRNLTLEDKRLLKKIVNHVTGSDDLLDQVRFNLANRGFRDFLGSGIANRIISGLLFTGAGAGAALGNPALFMSSGLLTLLTSPKFVGFLLKSGERGKITLNVIREIAKKQTAQNAIKAISNDVAKQ